MDRATIPLRLFGASDHQQDFLDSLPDGEDVIQNEYARHRLSRGHSLLRMIRHGGAIVRQQDAIVLRSPGQDVRIVRTA